MRIRTCGLDPDEQQPLYAGDQGDANGDDDGDVFGDKFGDEFSESPNLVTN